MTHATTTLTRADWPPDTWITEPSETRKKLMTNFLLDESWVWTPWSEIDDTELAEIYEEASQMKFE